MPYVEILHLPVEIVGGGVVELVLPGPLEAVLHAPVGPQALHQLPDLVGQLDLVALTGHLEEQAGVLLVESSEEGQHQTEKAFTECSLPPPSPPKNVHYG